MAESSVPIKMTATLKIEKYPDGATKEQIANGEVEPIEVVVSRDDFEASEEQVESIFGKDEVNK